MSNEKTTMRYLYLRIYSNEELQAYLSKMLEAGWAITKTKGNFLFFRRHQLKNARLCVVSTECTDRSPEYDDQVNEYIDIALRLGWQLLCIGDYESVLPMRRRLYFYTCDPDVAPLEPDEAIDFNNGYRAGKETRKWKWSWLLLCIAAWLTTIPFMLQGGFALPLVLVDGALASAAAAAHRLAEDRQKLYRSVTEGIPYEMKDPSVLRRKENHLTASLAVLLLGMLLLLAS